MKQNGKEVSSRVKEKLFLSVHRGGRDGFQWMRPPENALNVLDFYLQLAGSIKNVFLNGSSV